MCSRFELKGLAHPGSVRVLFYLIMHILTDLEDPYATMAAMKCCNNKRPSLLYKSTYPLALALQETQCLIARLY